MDGIFGNSMRAGLLASAAIVCAATPAPAMAQTRNFNLPEQGAASGVSAFARQADIQLLISARDAQGRRTRAVQGTMSVEQGLQRLLAGTGLRARSTGTRTWSVVPSGEAEAGSAAADDEGAEAAGVSEILVVGQRTLNTDIRRTEDDAQPYVVFEAEEIATSQATTVEEFIRSRLPMNNTVAGNAQNVAGVFGNQSSFDLRGLGPAQTLVLVDGRRLPSVSDAVGSGGFGQPDLNGIPLSAIERIEILPSTGSGIAGGGATGGIINVILRRDYQGFEIGGMLGWTGAGGARNWRVDAAAGFSLEGGRTRIRISGSHAEAAPLLTGQRDFAALGRALQFRNNPSAFTSVLIPPTGYTANIRSVSGANLVLDDGTPLGSPITFVPVGYAGPSTDNGRALVANAGRYNLDLNDDLLGARRSLVLAPNIDSVNGTIRREFGSRVELFLDGSWIDNRATFFNAGVPNLVTLAANAPNNPFNSSVRVRYPTPNLLYSATTSSQLLRFMAGAIVRLPHGWTAEAETGWSRSRLRSARTGSVLTPAGTTAISNGTLNVVRDVNQYPLDFSPYLLPSPNDLAGPFDTILKEVSGRVGGPLFRLPGGSAQLTLSVAHRDERARNSFEDVILGGAPATVYYPGRSQRVDSYYAELRLPLLSNAMPGAKLGELEFQASVRHDDYETRGATGPAAFLTLPSRSDPLPAVDRAINRVGSTDVTLALTYAPIPDVRLRASYGTGFLPPATSQLIATLQPADLFSIVDPRRGNMTETLPIEFISGGNAELRPERSTSLSLGLVVTPRFIPRLRFSADYTRIRKTNEIVTLDFRQIILNEDLFPGRVVRGANLPGDPPGFAGVITSVDFSALNAARSRIEAYDFQVDYSVTIPNVGEFRAFAVASWQPHLDRALLDTQPLANEIGFLGSPLEWRGNVGLTWTRGPLSLGWNAQYYDNYLVYLASATPASAAQQILSQGSPRISSQTYHDLFARYRFVVGSGGERNAELFFGIQNIFDTRPPILATTVAVGGYSTYGDPRLRRFTLAIRTRF